MNLTSNLIEVEDNWEAVNDWFLKEKLSDGLPIVPPTAARVEKMLAATTRDPAEVIGAIPPKWAPCSIEKIAINAVMAGCLPEYLPVIIAAVEAICEPRFNLYGVQATTHPVAPLLVVNGPYGRRIGLHSGSGCFGPGFRTNATIGRAIRLILLNVGGAWPGRYDMATQGSPAKFAYCIAENEAASPWAPLHVERGFAAGTSTVTVCGSEAPHNVNDHGSTTAEGMLRALAGTAATTGSNNVYLAGEPLVILGPEHAHTLAASGWAKAEVKRRLWELIRIRLDRFSAENLARFATIDPARFADQPPGAEVRWCLTPDDLMIIVAGGPGKHSSLVPTFGATRSVTVAIEAS
jgi:hypothetical protein